MSMKELALAVRDFIRADAPEGMGYRDDQCECMSDGRPPPKCGDVFISIHDGPVKSISRTCLDEYYSLVVTVTQRAPKMPFDRFGTDLLKKAAVGLNDRVRALRARLHGNYVILNAANTLLGVPTDPNPVPPLPGAGDPPLGFYEPLWVRREIVKAKLVGGDWLHANPDEEAAALVVDINLDGARRTQPMENLELMT